MTIEVHVRRKIRDLVRDAAEDALRTRWPELARLDRAEVWTFELESGDAADVAAILEETTLVANPNIHRWALAPPPAAAPAAGSRLQVTVREKVDAKGASVLRSLRDRLGRRDIRDVRRSVQWTLELPLARVGAESVGRAVTGQDGSGAGLLANPHAQDVEIRVLGPGTERTG